MTHELASRNGSEMLKRWILKAGGMFIVLALTIGCLYTGAGCNTSDYGHWEIQVDGHNIRFVCVPGGKRQCRLGGLTFPSLK